MRTRIFCIKVESGKEAWTEFNQLKLLRALERGDSSSLFILYRSLRVPTKSPKKAKLRQVAALQTFASFSDLPGFK
jgi:hypothetical protein